MYKILHFIFSVFICNTRLITALYTNTWAVQVAGSSVGEIERISRKYGFVNMGKVFSDSSYYHMKQRAVSALSLQAHMHNVRLKRDPKVLWFAQQSGKSRLKREGESFVLPKDPLFHEQWHLSNSFGHNIIAAWARGYTGKGVVVTILDDGLETTHPDLVGNYDAAASFDMHKHKPNPDPRPTFYNRNRHGTRCAGQIAAVANNSICGVGVAYHSKIGGIRMLDGPVTDVIEAKSLTFSPQHVHIYSASWGPADSGAVVDEPGALARQALIRGVSLGRRGLGSIFVWASGNGGMNEDNCNCDGYVNSIYTVAVSSTSYRAAVPSYSEPCAATLTTTYSGGRGRHRRIVTTDLHGSCTSEHSGTSASAPLAAGIIALTLEANPALTWRDVQHLVIRASSRSNLKADDWSKNGVGRYVSHYYGYGLLNAEKMVSLAKRWRAVKSQRRCQHAITQDKNLKISSHLRVTWNETGCRGAENGISSLEHVQVELSLMHTRRGDLTITLGSPSGTYSKLLTRRQYDRSTSGFSGWNFMTTRCWDENPTGVWTLVIRNVGDPQNKGYLKSLRIKLYGTDEMMTERRMERAVIHQCQLRNPDGTCKACAHPLYAYESICVEACPPHSYEFDGDSSDTPLPRHCQLCHSTCEMCSGPGASECMTCPPHSAFDPAQGTCSGPDYAWDVRGKVQASMDRTVAVLGILVGMPVTVLTVMWVIAWLVSRTFFPRFSQITSQTVGHSVQNSNSNSNGVWGDGNDSEVADVETVAVSVPSASSQEAEHSETLCFRAASDEASQA